MIDPLVVDVAQLRQRAGNTTPFSHVALLEGLSVGETSVVEDRIAIELTLEATIDGVSAGGQLLAAAVAPCRRCLDEVDIDVAVDVIEVFETDHESDDAYPLTRDDTIDLTPMVRDAVLLALPQLVLCGDDCAGPDPERFPTAAEAADAEPGEGEPSGDPRWAALDELDFD
jgi:uncharacterized protein